MQSKGRGKQDMLPSRQAASHWQCCTQCQTQKAALARKHQTQELQGRSGLNTPSHQALLPISTDKLFVRHEPACGGSFKANSTIQQTPNPISSIQALHADAPHSVHGDGRHAGLTIEVQQADGAEVGDACHCLQDPEALQEAS